MGVINRGRKQRNRGQQWRWCEIERHANGAQIMPSPVVFVVGSAGLQLWRRRYCRRWTLKICKMDMAKRKN